MVRNKRQAGQGDTAAAESAAASARAFKITPEMISAGVAALEAYRGSYPDCELVEAVYSAMTEASMSSGGSSQGRERWMTF
jgi:hypothetical protein